MLSKTYCLCWRFIDKVVYVAATVWTNSWLIFKMQFEIWKLLVIALLNSNVTIFSSQLSFANSGRWKVYVYMCVFWCTCVLNITHYCTKMKHVTMLHTVCRVTNIRTYMDMFLCNLLRFNILLCCICRQRFLVLLNVPLRIWLSPNQMVML